MRAVLFLAVLLGGCAGVPTTPNVGHLFADSLFAPVQDPPRRDEVLALSPAMRDYLKGRIQDRIDDVGPRRGLYEALRDELTLDYDTTTTRTAAEAFEVRAGNCLSLVILTAAFARELDIPLRYQSVYGYDTWSRVNGITFLSGHVNLVLGRGGSVHDGWGRVNETDNLIVDFVAPQSPARQHVREIPEATVLAMFMNNRAAEILAEGDANRAYWWAREAIKVSPWFVASFNTLGVIYRHHGNRVLAERALRFALEREPDNTSALTNLVGVLAEQGRTAEWKEVLARLQGIEPYPPYHFFDQGMAAMARRDYAAARALFARELRRMPYDDEVHFALAVASINLGEYRQARRQLAAAFENSTTRDRRGIYAAKLEKLKELQMP